MAGQTISPDRCKSRGGRSASCALASQGSSLHSSGDPTPSARANVAAEVTTPNEIELLDKRFDECRIVCQNTVLEIASLLRLRAHSGAGEVGRAEIRLAPINDDALEMYSRTQHPFHPPPQIRIAVEVIPPVRLGLLRPLRGSVSTLLRANVAIHSRSLICGTIPQMTDS